MALLFSSQHFISRAKILLFPDSLTFFFSFSDYLQEYECKRLVVPYFCIIFTKSKELIIKTE